MCHITGVEPFKLEVHQAKQLQCHRNLCSTWLIGSSVKQGRIAKTDNFIKQELKGEVNEHSSTPSCSPVVSRLSR